MEKTSNKNSGGFVKSIFILSVGGLVAKLLGAFYRIPLTNVVGSYGMGIYQLVFPLFSLLLTISTAGIPVAVSKLVAEKTAVGDRYAAKRIFSLSLAALSILGLVCSLLLFVLSDSIAAMQGNADASFAYKLISPAVFLVCVISAYRGYFQGLLHMTPTALSQIIEQVVKMSVGLYCAVKFMPDVLKAVNGAVLAVTLSELAAAIFLAVLYFKRKDKQFDTVEVKSDFKVKPTLKRLLLLCLPITLSGLIIPLTQLVDSVLVLNIIKQTNATELYGLWAGPVHSLLNMPVVLTLGIATAIVPAVSEHYAKNDFDGAAKKAAFSVKLTTAVGLPCVAGLIVLAYPVTKLLYGGLSHEEISLASQMVVAAGASILFLSLVQTSTALLQAGGRLYAPVLFLFGATVVKTVCCVLLLKNPSVGIFGAPLSSVICYFVACSGDLLYIVHVQKIPLSLSETLFKPLACTLVMTVFLMAVRNIAQHFLPNAAAVFVLIAFGGLIYFVMTVLLKVFDKSEAERLPVVGRYLKKMYGENEK